MRLTACFATRFCTNQRFTGSTPLKGKPKVFCISQRGKRPNSGFLFFLPIRHQRNLTRTTKPNQRLVSWGLVKNRKNRIGLRVYFSDFLYQKGLKWHYIDQKAYGQERAKLWIVSNRGFFTNPTKLQKKAKSSYPYRYKLDSCRPDFGSGEWQIRIWFLFKFEKPSTSEIQKRRVLMPIFLKMYMGKTIFPIYISKNKLKDGKVVY